MWMLKIVHYMYYNLTRKNKVIIIHLKICIQIITYLNNVNLYLYDREEFLS
jgi:hypothetical protein